MSEKKKEGKGKKRKDKKERKQKSEAAGGDVVTSAASFKLKKLKSQDLTEGKKLVLKCETNSEDSSQTFKWYKDGKEISGSNKPKDIRIQKRKKKISELRIKKVKASHAGEYKCEVFNKFGHYNSSANIVVRSVATTAPIGTGHVTRCNDKEKTYCVNGGECFVLSGITTSTRYLCR
ncbi:pro-neuregulin-1, membrane-bound isoform-like [Latimeria chalumnae]|uniref:pro-neuregulin-1, membrane-bound isoform-like n=1 Tax=Latimeria chalumnae TaxID=7897 RepID=UPI00313AA451